MEEGGGTPAMFVFFWLVVFVIVNSGGHMVMRAKILGWWTINKHRKMR